MTMSLRPFPLLLSTALVMTASACDDRGDDFGDDEVHATEGDPTEGDAAEGDATEGDPTEGDPAQGDATAGDATAGETFADHEGDPCDSVGSLVECDANGSVNVCFAKDGALQYGPCHEAECTLGDRRSCGELDGTATCELGGNGRPYWDCVDGTPLVLSFDGAEPTMMAAHTRAFDVGTGGACLQTDWPSADTPWLALDRDGNGSIDGGHELFGSGTVMANGRRAPHGFAALAELDTNGDGRISAEDGAWDRLVLWSDHDADKRSTPWEHASLQTRGIVSIELSWHAAPVCDDRGNCGVERAEFTFLGRGGALVRGEVIDVHLPCR